MNGHEALLGGIAKANDALRNVFISRDTVVSLLKANAAARDYDVVLELQDGWFFEYKAFRQQFLLDIAIDASDLTDAMGVATHIAIGDDVYRIVQQDTVPPMGTDVSWKVYCERFETRSASRVLY